MPTEIKVEPCDGDHHVNGRPKAPCALCFRRIPEKTAGQKIPPAVVKQFDGDLFCCNQVTHLSSEGY